MKEITYVVTAHIRRFVQDDVSAEQGALQLADELIDKFKDRLMFSHVVEITDEDFDGQDD